MDKSGNAVALSHPFDVAEHRDASVLARSPRAGTDVLVVLERARVAPDAEADPVAMTLDVNGRTSAPDVFVSAADRLYAIWYGVDAPRALFKIISSTSSLPAEELRLKPQSVVTVRRKLQRLPSIDVSVHAPAGAFDDVEKTIDVLLPGRPSLRHVTLTSDTTRQDFLPAEELRVVLTIGPWRFTRDVDLRDHEDREVVFDLQPIVVNGTVHRGRKPAAGEVKFYLGQQPVTAQTDEQGAYEITLWESRSYVVEIALRDDRGPPFREYFVEIPRSQRRDFHIPDSNYVVRVTDAETDAPIAGAEIAVGNVFKHATGAEQQTSQQAIANAKGEATLPPLQPGTLSLVVSAKGYVESAPIERRVTDSTERQEIAVRLQAERSDAALELQLASGAPAANAEVTALRSGSEDEVLWRSATDSNGRVDLPRRVSGALLVIRHEAASSLARVWEEGAATWRLPAMGPPLRVRVTDAAGQPAPFAHLVLRVDGILLRGAALRSLTGKPPLTNRDGWWEASGIAGSRIEIFATRDPRLPVLDALAQVVASPPPAEITVRVAE